MPVLFVCFDTMAVWLQLLVLKICWPFIIFQPKRLVNIFSV